MHFSTRLKCVFCRSGDQISRDWNTRSKWVFLAFHSSDRGFKWQPVRWSKVFWLICISNIWPRCRYATWSDDWNSTSLEITFWSSGQVVSWHLGQMIKNSYRYKMHHWTTKKTFLNTFVSFNLPGTMCHKVNCLSRELWSKK